MTHDKNFHRIAQGKVLKKVHVSLKPYRAFFDGMPKKIDLEKVRSKIDINKYPLKEYADFLETFYQLFQKKALIDMFPD